MDPEAAPPPRPGPRSRSEFFADSDFRTCTHRRRLINVRPPLRRYLYGALAQLGERLHGMQEVRGSTPLGSTISLFDTCTKDFPFWQRDFPLRPNRTLVQCAENGRWKFLLSSSVISLSSSICWIRRHFCPGETYVAGILVVLLGGGRGVQQQFR